MKKKSLVMLGLVAGLSVLSAIQAFAGEWKQDSKGWWYQEDNGSYPTSAWKWIDGNNDGIAECYYFDQSGYALMNTVTPDNCTVNADGAWTVNGVVQTKQTNLNANNNENSDISKYAGTYVWKNGVVKISSEKLIFSVKNGALTVTSQADACRFDTVTLEDAGIEGRTHEFKYENGDVRYYFTFYDDNSDFLLVMCFDDGFQNPEFVRE